jgi:hypothetical protein
VVTVYPCSGPVFFADRVDAGGVAERCGVGGADLIAEGTCRAASRSAEGVTGYRVRGAGDQPLGQRLRLGQQ